MFLRVPAGVAEPVRWGTEVRTLWAAGRTAVGQWGALKLSSMKVLHQPKARRPFGRGARNAAAASHTECCLVSIGDGSRNHATWSRQTRAEASASEEAGDPALALGLFLMGVALGHGLDGRDVVVVFLEDVVDEPA